MKCLFCNTDMETGRVSIFSTQGDLQILLSYTSIEESKKSIFRRKTKDVNSMQGEEIEAYYCSSCKMILPIFFEE
ncbi:MAG: hypothetical protein IJD40_06010 [Lachnospiraceae bacterium]|nr:hypothetical protein [Lachnospiraceae bacterium]